jgi:hypothetical protein
MKLSVSTSRILFLLVIWFDLIPPQAVRQRYELTWFVLFVCTYFLLLCPPSLMISIFFLCWKSSASVSCQNSTEMHFFLYYDWPETGPRKFLGFIRHVCCFFFLSYLSKLHKQPTNIHERYLLREMTKNTKKLFEIKIPKFGSSWLLVNLLLGGGVSSYFSFFYFLVFERTLSWFVFGYVLCWCWAE